MNDEVKTARILMYLGDRVIADGECEVAMTARTTCVWAKVRQYGRSLLRKRFPLKLKTLFTRFG